MSATELKGRVKDARVAMYREVILDAAEEVFAENGYEAAKVQAVAASAGVSLATLYGVFTKKWDLYCALHERRIAQLMERIGSRGVFEEVDPLTRLLDGVDGYLEFHMEHPTYLRMHLQDGLAWASGGNARSPEQARAWSMGVMLMTAAFQAGIDAGIFVADDPGRMARTAIAMHQVRLGDWIDSGMSEPIAEVAAQVRRQFVRAFCVPERVPELLGKHAP
ncbi:MAG: TetR/AcrR family transcriptional regulator [Polyangiaceae bacterium]|nr:TetR/AcrR family transcriptional regulator [Polyangiaceae bacterium]